MGISVQDTNISALVEKQQKVESELKRVKKEVADSQTTLLKLTEQFDDAKADLGPVEDTNKSTIGRLKGFQTQLKELDGKGGHAKLAMFSPNTPNFKSRVVNASPGTFRGRVIGPVGMELKIKPDKKKWAQLCEVALGPGIMGAFICEDSKDLQTLSRMRQASSFWVQTVWMSNSYISSLIKASEASNGVLFSYDTYRFNQITPNSPYINFQYPDALQNIKSIWFGTFFRLYVSNRFSHFQFGR